jgi:predicted flavoprotein YhiN
MAANSLGVETVTGKQVTYDELTDLLKSNPVILATGGLAAPATGSTGDGLSFMAKLGHTVMPPYPALTSLKINHPGLPSLKGIRLKPCKLTMNGVSHTGEVLFTEYGLSGIPAMQLSGCFTGPTDIHLDLLPDMSREEAMQMLNAHAVLPYMRDEPYAGLFHKNLSAVLLKSKADLKDFTMQVTGVMGYNHAQVTGGGVTLNEFDPASMKSLRVQNLFAAGEVLDVYGDCGGYNLHWAWTTGIKAGQGAVKALEERI